MGDTWDGRPQNPERDGWHWVMVAHGIGHPFPMMWGADGAMWDAGDAGWVLAGDLASRWRYLGPCLAPDEVAAREAAAAEAMREQASKHCAGVAAFLSSPDEICVAMACAVGVGRLSLPAADALARALEQERAEARAEERDACAQIAEDEAKDCEPFEMGDGWATAMTIRDAIRARGKEVEGE